MGPRWVLLAALLRAAGGRNYSLPYTPQSAQCRDPSTEFYEGRLKKCCSKCPPGQRKAESCGHSTDTKCIPCSPDTYTAVWNWSPQCFACSPPCREGFVEHQTCTLSQDRICSCPPNEYCLSKTYQHCHICKVHKKCGKGYRVSRRGTDSTDTECKPCPPGTFSDEESYDTSCIPHTVCQSVAVAGSSVNDTVCHDSVATVLPHAVVNLVLSQSSASNSGEIITQPVILTSVPDMSYIIGSVTGPLLLVLIIAGLGCCLFSKKRVAALAYSQPSGAAESPFSPTEKQQCDEKVRNAGSQNSSSSEQEEQHLLETPGSSSSSSLGNTAGSARVGVINNKDSDKKESFQQHYSAAEGGKHRCGDRHSSASSELSGNGGTQVNVTCIVKVCNPDCGSHFPEQTGPTSMDDGSAQCSPTGREVLLSKEENPLKKETAIQIVVEAKDNLLQDLLLDAKKFPLGVQDMEMNIV